MKILRGGCRRKPDLPEQEKAEVDLPNDGGEVLQSTGLSETSEN